MSGLRYPLEPTIAPMYVLPISSLLEYDQLPGYEQLRADDRLELHDEHKPTAFISHTWLGSAHPDDPEGSFFLLLKDVLTRVQRREMQIQAFSVGLAPFFGLGRKEKLGALKDGYIWLDWCCVPQRETRRSASWREQFIRSIPSYVARCHYFFVLAGAWTHEDGSVRDLRAWQSRGWCRMEQLSNALSPHPRPFVVFESTRAMRAWPPSGVLGHNIFAFSVGEGAFSVDRDRLALGPVILSLIGRAERRAKERGERSAFQFLRAIAGLLLTGLEEAIPAWRVPRGMRPFVHHHRLDPQSLVQTSSRRSLSALACAVMSGNHDIAAQLLAQGASAQDIIPRGEWMWPLTPYAHAGVLEVAALFGWPEMVRLLLRHGANPRRSVAAGLPSAIHAAACCARTRECVEVLLEADPSLGHLGLKPVGWRPFHLALFTGRAAIVAYFAEYHPHLMHLEQPDLSPSGMVLTAFGDLDTLRVAIGLSRDVEDCRDTVGSPLLRAIFRVADAIASAPLPLLRCGLGQRLYNSRAAMSRCTALHVAAFRGHLRAIDLLLERGSSPSSTRHPFGFTPLHTAAIRGHEKALGRLLAAGADPSIRCSRGMTALDWADFWGVDACTRLLRSGSSTEMCRACP